MSDRPTPETDADNDTQCELAAWELLREARRERDEARNKMADALQEIDLRTLDFERMKQERDEAREEAHIWRAKAGFDKYDNFSWEETAK